MFLPACTGTDLLTFISPVCMGGPASVRKGVPGSWQSPFCHLAPASGKQDELRPVMKVKQDKLFFKMSRQLFFFFIAFGKLRLYWSHSSSCRNTAFNVTISSACAVS